MNKILYQVVVRTRNNNVISVGPKMEQFAAEMLCDAIKGQIRAGKEKHWNEPMVVAEHLTAQ